MNILRKPFKYKFYNFTIILIIINFLVFFVSLLLPKIKIYLGMSFYGLKFHMYWQAITYMFVHSGWSHIIFNMLALFIFGIQIERSIGSWEFLTFYMICGILDGFISIALYRILGINTLLIGASGAIYALLLLYSVIFPRSVISIWGIIPVPAPLLVGIYAVIELVSQIIGSDNVAHLTHLSGFFLAWLYLKVRMGISPVKVWKNAYDR